MEYQVATGTGQTLGTGSLELVRAKLRSQIRADESLTRFQKRRVMRELNSLISYEYERRYRAALNEQQIAEVNHVCNLNEKIAEVANKLKVERAEAEASAAKAQFEAFSYRLQLVERVLKLKKLGHSPNHNDTFRKELERFALRQKLAEKREEMLSQQITRRVINRARFRQMVEREFPDMADELMEDYDRQLYQEGEED